MKILKPALILTVICIVVTAAIAGVNLVTKDTIASAEKAAEESARAVVMPADSYNEVQDGCFAAIKDGGTVGYVITTAAKSGYSGSLVTVMTGINADGTIAAVTVLSCDDETPGLGQNAAKSDFTDQFIGKSGKQSVTKDGGEIAAVTSATLTSRAVCDAVSEACAIYDSVKGVG